MKLFAALSLILLSVPAMADLKMVDYCYKLPPVMGGDSARIRVRYYAEHDQNGIYAYADLLTVEPLSGKIFEGAKGDASPEVLADFKGTFPATIRLRDDKQFLLADSTLVESIKFIAVRKTFGSSRYASELNELVKRETGITPGHPVLRIESDDGIKAEVAGSECAK